MTYIPINPAFDDLPLLQLRPAMSDDDTAFHSDMSYLRDLMVELHAQAIITGRARNIPPPRDIPPTWSDQLAAACDDCTALSARIREFTR